MSKANPHSITTKRRGTPTLAKPRPQVAADLPASCAAPARDPDGVTVFTAAFAMLCDTDCMEPRYLKGEALYCNPNRQITDRCYVIVELVDGRSIVKELVKRTDRQIVLHQFNPPKDIHLDISEVKAIYRVVACGDADDDECKGVAS